MNKFFHDLVTGTSNLDYELSRVLWLVGGLAFIVYSGMHIALNGEFKPLEFGGGFGALMAGGGWGTAVKDRAKTEAEGIVK